MLSALLLSLKHSINYPVRIKKIDEIQWFCFQLIESYNIIQATNIPLWPTVNYMHWIRGKQNSPEHGWFFFMKFYRKSMLLLREREHDTKQDVYVMQNLTAKSNVRGVTLYRLWFLLLKSRSVGRLVTFLGCLFSGTEFDTVFVVVDLSKAGTKMRDNRNAAWFETSWKLKWLQIEPRSLYPSVVQRKKEKINMSLSKKQTREGFAAADKNREAWVAS